MSGMRILVVDDEPQVGRIVVRILEAAGYEAECANSAAEARDTLRAGDIAVVIADVNMPGESGIDLLRDIVAEHVNVATMMVSGIDDPGVAEIALELGAYGYLTKPIRRADLVIAVMNAFRRRELEARERAARDRLRAQVAARTSDLQRTLARLDSASDQLAQTRDENIRQLARAVELRDLETGDHVERMSRYCALLAGRAGLDAESIRVASQMHDIGKIAVPDAILLKPGPLTGDERKVMERHTVIGYDLLRESSSETLKLGSVIALTHHERFDGTGYPHGLAGEDIPLEGRIAAIADVFDALTTERVYRGAMPVSVAVATMQAERGTHFDPGLLDLFVLSLPDVNAIRSEFEPRIRIGAAQLATSASSRVPCPGDRRTLPAA